MRRLFEGSGSGYPRFLGRATLGALMAFGCAACVGTSDPHHPGVDLGTFHVTAKEKMTTCGEGALGSTPTWEFDVKLARGETTLFWDNGAEIIPGKLSADRVSFAFETGVIVDMREGQMGTHPPCSIRRTDKAAGALDSAGPGVQAFSGSLSYAFAEEPSELSDCSDVVSGSMPVLAALPCSMEYDLSATLKEAPSAEEDEGTAALTGAGEERSEGVWGVARLAARTPER